MVETVFKVNRHLKNVAGTVFKVNDIFFENKLIQANPIWPSITSWEKWGRNSFQGWLARALKIQKNPLVKTDVKTSLWLRNIAILCPWWHQAGPFWCRGKPWPNHCRGRSGPNWCRGKSGLNWCRGKSGPNWCRGKSWPNWGRGKSGQNWCRGKSWRNWCRGKSSECAQEVAKRGCNDSHRWNSKFRNREFSKLTFPSASKLVWKSLWGRMPN